MLLYSSVKQCFPKENFVAWSCKHLLMSPLFRIFHWMAGILVLVLESLALAWVISEIKSKANVINFLTLFSFILGWLNGLYFLSISVIDNIFANSYSFYHEIWQSHIACTLINILSYTVYNMQLFVSVMIGYARMIAVAFPFKAAQISTSGVLSVCFSWLFLSLVVGCLPYTTSAVFSSSVEGRVLGFGLLVPSVDPKNWSWAVGSVLCPMGCKMLTFISFYSVALLSVRNSIHKFKMHGKHGNQRSYVNTIWRIISTLVSTICGYLPVFTTHILNLCGYMVNRRAAVVITSVSLFALPCINLVLYAGTSTAFRKFTIHLLNSMVNYKCERI